MICPGLYMPRLSVLNGISLPKMCSMKSLSAAGLPSVYPTYISTGASVRASARSRQSLKQSGSRSSPYTPETPLGQHHYRLRAMLRRKEDAYLVGHVQQLLHCRGLRSEGLADIVQSLAKNHAHLCTLHGVSFGIWAQTVLTFHIHTPLGASLARLQRESREQPSGPRRSLRFRRAWMLA